MLRFQVFRFHFLILLSIFTFIILLQFTDEDVRYHKFTSVGKLKDDEPVDDRNIFFINTSDTTSGIDLKPRQACAVESAAVMNPDRRVYVLITTPLSFLDYPANPFVRAVLSYPNVRLKHFDVIEITKHTPLERWILNSTLFKSTFLDARLSDVYRLVVLWKYQGIYLDMDTMTLKNFKHLPMNFACVESDHKNRIGNAFMGVDTDGGRKFIELFLTELMRSYDRDRFTQTGPEMITRVLMTLCDRKNVDEMSSTVCEGFNVLPQKKCSNLNYEDWERVFDEKSTKEVIETLNDSHIVHFWSSQSDSKVFRSKAKSAFNVLGKIHCPKVMQHVGEFIT